jgi:hypothetical protein
MMGWASFSFFQRQENGFPPWFFVVFHAGELLVLKTALRVSNSHRCQILSRMLDLKGMRDQLLLSLLTFCSPVTGQPCFTLKEFQSSGQMGCC